MDSPDCLRCQAALKLWVRDESGSIIERLVRLEEQSKGALKALELQAEEYERRLDALNDLSTYVLSAYKEKVDGRLDVVTEELAEIKGVAGGKSSTRHLVIEIITMLIAAVAIAASVFLATR